MQHGAVKYPPKLPTIVADRMRRAIEEGIYNPTERLPSESELARLLGVSRTTLRQAIATLEEEGIVQRRHGLGTFVAARNAVLRNNINANFGVTDLIESAGWRAGTRDLRVRAVPAESRTRDLLALPAGSSVLVVDRVRLADGRPVVYATDILPRSLLLERGVEPAAVLAFAQRNESLYRTLEAIGVLIHHGIAELHPAVADDELAARLEVARGTLLLHIEQVDYSAHGDPILLSHEYHVADAFSVKVYRRGPGEHT